MVCLDCLHGRKHRKGDCPYWSMARQVSKENGAIVCESREWVQRRVCVHG